MKKQINLWLLFVLPIFIPVLVYGVRFAQSKREVHYDIGGNRGVSAGEIAAMKKLADIIQHHGTANLIWVRWNAKPLYGLQFDSFNKRLVKVECCTAINGRRQALVDQYENVTNRSIILVATHNGLASDLTESGAMRKKRSTAQFDSQGQLILEW